MYDVRGLLTAMGPGRMGTTAYDTAWVARLADIAPTLSNHALEWISEHQLADGSWGAEQPLYYHDRIVSTLAAMLALAHRGRRAYDRVRIENGLKALDRLTSDATRRLASDANGAPAGFEMIVPTLVTEAETLGIIKQQGDRILGRLGQARRAKLAKLKGIKINRYVTTALSAELAGQDALDMLDIDNLQESNGSVGNSPSATAHFAIYARPGDRGALLYLHDVLVDGGAPFVSPFENFERIWILWNLHIGGLLGRDIMPLARPHLDSLKAQWKPGQGLGFSSTYSLMDGDDTSLGYDLLTDLGYPVDLDAVLSFEEKDHFRCFNLEVNASIDVNIHVLGALRRAGCGVDHPSVQKALNFVRKRRLTGKYWIDKWNASPFYTTAHAIIFCQGYDDEMCQTAVDWMLKMQNSNGGWGFYRAVTAEETAYCLQALSIWRKTGGKVPGGRIEQGARWLRGHTEPPYPPLWIGKSLYCPDLLVQSTILSALALAGG